jgi:hypothetical protein
MKKEKCAYYKTKPIRWILQTGKMLYVKVKNRIKGTRGIEFGNVELNKFSKNPTLSKVLLRSTFKY